MRKITVLMPKMPFGWKSMEEILPALLKSWVLLRKKGHQVRVIKLSRADCKANLKLPKDTTDLVILSLDEFDSKSLLTQLNKNSIAQTCRWWLHLHGEPQMAMMFWGERLLPEQTTYIVACEAERKSLRLTRPKACCVVLPFPLAKKSKLKKIKTIKNQNSVIRLGYAGRISEQKKLDVLIHAVHILRDRGHEVVLDIWGPFDESGNILFGEKKTRVKSDLSRLVRKLRLEKFVRFRGKISRHQLKHQWGADRIFVSASVHWDENFGAAAFQALENQSLAVLSSWGGHQQLKKIFLNRVNLVPVTISKRHLQIRPEDFARAILNSSKASRTTKVRAISDLPTPAKASSTLNQLLRRKRPVKGRSQYSQFAAYISTRYVSKYNSRTKIFDSFLDPLAKPFMISYGAKVLRSQTDPS
jgi:glycosyltransferase involved in cell wall biosynthesis